MQGFENKKSKVDRQGHFLQSREWEEFQRSLGREIFCVDDILVAKLSLALGKSYLYSAGAQFPIPNPPAGGQFPNNFQNSKFQALAEQHNAVFLKLEPMTENEELSKELLNAGFRKSKKEVQPQRTIVLDLTKSEEELLSEMHGKTRYNIRLARRNSNVKCQMSNDCEEFWTLLQKTADRDKFSTYAREYYKKLLELPITRLFTAKYEGKIIAANIILFYGDTAYYLHGASDYECRSLMVPYLLHWETIKYAKDNGFTQYDFWGIDEKKWPGLTRFKKGFGGKEAEYIGSYDYVFQPFWYKLYNLRNLAITLTKN